MTGQFTVPVDFLITASLNFTAVVSGEGGGRRSAKGSTLVVAAGPDTTSVESGFGDEFPTVFLTAPRQAIPAQLLNVTAVAPAARVEFDLPSIVRRPTGIQFC